MWAINNLTPFAAERTWIRDINGAEVWLVVVKGTFLINSDGSTELADKQEDVCRVPKFLDEPGKSSLLYESDLVHTKPTTDVIVHGTAYAPHGRLVPQVDVTMKIANMTKTLRVFGDRVWYKGALSLKMSDPQPFEKIPVTYERAFGGADQKSSDPQNHGWESRNPVGIGFAVAPEHLVNQRAPNVEYPNTLISSWEQRPQPAGFGPIARAWSPRVKLAGTYDEKWKKERLPLLPEDFNEHFYLCAPPDQQAQNYLRGGESVVLLNLTPEGLLRFYLPRVVLNFQTYFGRETIDHRGTLHTVILEPDIPRVLMVWHTMLSCHHKALKLQSTTVKEKMLRLIGRDS